MGVRTWRLVLAGVIATTSVLIGFPPSEASALEPLGCGYDPARSMSFASNSVIGLHVDRDGDLLVVERRTGNSGSIVRRGTETLWIDDMFVWAVHEATDGSYWARRQPARGTGPVTLGQVVHRRTDGTVQEFPVSDLESPVGLSTDDIAFSFGGNELKEYRSDGTTSRVEDFGFASVGYIGRATYLVVPPGISLPGSTASVEWGTPGGPGIDMRTFVDGRPVLSGDRLLDFHTDGTIVVWDDFPTPRIVGQLHVDTRIDEVLAVTGGALVEFWADDGTRTIRHLGFDGSDEFVAEATPLDWVETVDGPRILIETDRGQEIIEPLAADDRPRRPGGNELDDQIQRLFSAFFLRQPDAAGAAHWSATRASGESLESIAQAFADSAEFRARYGELTNPEFVDLVYTNVLGRPPDPTGRSFWTDQLDNGTSRGDVMTGFSESTEYRIRTGTARANSTETGEIARLFSAFFLRDADDEGFCFWWRQRRAGTSLESIAQAFADSAEFRARYGELTNPEFVDLVYTNVLGRPPDPTGRSFWTDQLDNGTSRGDVMTGFSESTEYRIRTGTL